MKLYLVCDSVWGNSVSYCNALIWFQTFNLSTSSFGQDFWWCWACRMMNRIEMGTGFWNLTGNSVLCSPNSSFMGPLINTDQNQDKDLYASDVLKVRKVRFICIFLFIRRAKLGVLRLGGWTGLKLRPCPVVILWCSDRRSHLVALLISISNSKYLGRAQAQNWKVLWFLRMVLLHFHEGFLRVVDQRCLVMSKLPLVKGWKFLYCQ